MRFTVKAILTFDVDMEELGNVTVSELEDFLTENDVDVNDYTDIMVVPGTVKIKKSA